MHQRLLRNGIWWASSISKDTHKWYKSLLNRSLVGTNHQNFGEADGVTMYLPVEELLPWEKFHLNSANGGGKKMWATSTYVSLALPLGYLTWLMVKEMWLKLNPVSMERARIWTIYTGSHLSSWISGNCWAFLKM